MTWLADLAFLAIAPMAIILLGALVNTLADRGRLLLSNFALGFEVSLAALGVAVTSLMDTSVLTAAGEVRIEAAFAVVFAMGCVVLAATIDLPVRRARRSGWGGIAYWRRVAIVARTYFPAFLAWVALAPLTQVS